LCPDIGGIVGLLVGILRGWLAPRIRIQA
jgi:hypothetical protein